MTVRENARAFLGVVDVPLVAAAAVAAYCLLAWLVVDRGRVLPVSRERMVEMKGFLEKQAASGVAGDVFFLGSSVLIEGVDCGIVDPSLPAGRKSYNLAWTGADARQWILVLPSLKAAKPACVVACVDIAAVRNAAPIAEDLLTIANWWRFLPDADLAVLGSLLSSAERSALAEPRVYQLFAFRTFPTEAFDAYMREVSRPDLRYAGYAANFKAPWVRKTVVSPSAMERGIRLYEQGVMSRSSENEDQALTVLNGVVSYLQGIPSRVVIVFSPINPAMKGLQGTGLIDGVRRRLSDLAAKTGAAFLDHSRLLSADQYSDHVHPSESGRIAWSKALGQAISEILPAER